MTVVVEINEPQRLEDYRLAWSALLAETAGASFFQSLDWLACYWRHFGGEQRLRVLAVYSGGRPLGILPLTVLRERTRLGRLRVLTYPLHDWGTFYGPLGPNPAATLTAALHYLAGRRRDWDLLDLRWVDAGRRDRGRTPRAMEAAGFSASAAVWKEIAVVEMSGTWDEYFASKTTKFRNNMRRYEKRVREIGEVNFYRHRPLGTAHGDDDPRWDLYDAAVEVAERSWQAQSPDGTTICTPHVRDFFRETYALAVRAGMADLCLLTAGRRPVAFGYNYVCGGRLLGIRFGYDQQLCAAGAGNVMYMNIFRDSFARGDREFDLGAGSLDVKRQWMTRLVSSYRYTHYPLACCRSQALRLKHWWTRRMPNMERRTRNIEH